MHDKSPAAGAPEPTRRVLAFHARTLDEARAAVGRNYYPHRLAQLTTDSDLDMSLRTVQLGPVSVGRLSYGVDVSIHLDELESAYHVNIPMSGGIESEAGGEPDVVTRGRASIYLPHRSTRITRWSADCVVYGIKFDRAYLESELRALLGRPVGKPVTFDPVFDLSSKSGASWLALVRTLAAELDDDSSLLYNELVSSRLVDAVTTGLLLTAAHDSRELLDSPAHAARPRTISRAIDAIHAHPEEPWTVSGLAMLVGVSVRTLQDGFRRYVGVSPLAYLRDVRLERAHEDLIQADPSDVAVTDVAYRWGFQHLGRFALEYRKRYGQPPSKTLTTT
ncbi:MULTISPECIES: AraC family transcriptional regulator [Rhodococcus]|uniref:AraC family transcriptional regulator n=1 Tax=Rhodococcus TaxID=1827 RepID=UPI001AE4CB56|nr:MULTISPECIES: AraC family transcriptional regulator [Rhodococcus]MBP1159429.1 AraC-like DNA-binding protein [Rhodococcus sp. PvR099]MCZ4556731.1 AraC family transcriptional regulator [Rhodococcus maanshanensis]